MSELDHNTTPSGKRIPPLDPYQWDLILPLAIYITDPVDWELCERFVHRTLHIRGNKELARFLREHKLPPEQMPYFIQGLQIAMHGASGNGGIKLRDASGAFMKKRMRDKDALPILRKTVHEEAIRLARRFVEDDQRF